MSRIRDKFPSVSPRPSRFPSVSPRPSRFPSVSPLPSRFPSVSPLPSRFPSVSPRPSRPPSVMRLYYTETRWILMCGTAGQPSSSSTCEGKLSITFWVSMRNFQKRFHASIRPHEAVNPFPPEFEKYILPTRKCVSDVVSIGCIIIFHLPKLRNAKFSVLCDVIFLVRLQEKFDIDHSCSPTGWQVSADDQKSLSRERIPSLGRGRLGRAAVVPCGWNLWARFLKARLG